MPKKPVKPDNRLSSADTSPVFQGMASASPSPASLIQQKGDETDNLTNKAITTAVKDTSIATSLFQNHLLAIKNPQPKIHTTSYDYWVTGILMFLYILFVWMYVSNYKKLSQIIKGIYINHNSNQMSREDLSIGNRVSVFLSIFFILTLTLFISRVLSYFDFHPSPFGQDNVVVLNIITAIIITIAYGIKFASIKLLGYIFKAQKEASEYMMTIFLFCNTLGLFMLPLIVCLTYVKQVSPIVFIYAGIGFIIIFFSIRLVRGLFLGLNRLEISKIYLFMYLCALEILPIIIIIKLFMLYII